MDRGAVISINGVEYPLVLTVKATREIQKKFGGLDKLGEMLSDGSDLDSMLDLVSWLIVLLANQAIIINNLNTGAQDPILDDSFIEYFEQVTSLPDLKNYMAAIVDALGNGAKRYVISDEPVGTAKKARGV